MDNTKSSNYKEKTVRHSIGQPKTTHTTKGLSICDEASHQDGMPHLSEILFIPRLH